MIGNINKQTDIYIGYIYINKQTDIYIGYIYINKQDYILINDSLKLKSVYFRQFCILKQYSADQTLHQRAFIKYIL